MRLRVHVLAGVLMTSVLFAGCGGNPSPTDPTPTVTVLTSSPMIFFNGRTGQPVNLSGVAITTSRGNFTVNSGGTVEMLTTDLKMTITVPGYRGPYKTTYQSGRTSYVLSPDFDPSSGLTEEYVKQMLFGDASGYNNPGLQPMRILKSSMSFYFEPSVNATGAMKTELATRVSQFQTATDISSQVSNGAVPGTIGCPISFDSNLQYQATTTLSVVKGLVTSCKIVFHSSENYIGNVILHELLHTFGLFHWNGRGMIGKSWDPNNLVYSPAELEGIKLLKSMTPSSSYVYDDSSAAANSSISSVSSVVTTYQVVFNCDNLK